jgi:Leucine-rich repeat (LRR) protein
MPPKGKPQLSNQEKQILDWWIKNGADFNKKAKEISQTAADKKALFSFQSGENSTVSESIIPETEVSEPSKTALEILQKAGVVVNRISPETNYVTITVFENKLQEIEISALKELKKNILILIARGHKDKNLIAEIGNFSNLRKLNLAESGITDDDLNKFSSLAELRVINLGGTAVTEKGLLNLKTLGKLKTIFVYNSKFNKKQFNQLKAQFPKTRIDTGGYQISQSDSLKFVM